MALVWRRTAATLLAVHFALHWIAVALGAASIVTYAHVWLRGKSSAVHKPRPETAGRIIHWAFSIRFAALVPFIRRERAMKSCSPI